jgi:tetratricopeptide (TPR) repeat protein
MHINDIHKTLITWRSEALKAPEMPIKVEPDITGKWPDELSCTAAADIAGRGIDIPWSHGDVFGDSESKVIGLRSGGIGLVYFVESSMNEAKRLYAAKTLNSFLKPDYLDLAPRVQEEIAQAFLEETLPWLEMGRHSHIISVHMLENILHPVLNRNIPFVYSEYVPGGNLRQYFNEKGTLTYREILTLGIQLCDGLIHAYKHGLEAHRDIKPDNVMVSGKRTFKLTDFSTNVIGTPGYMAPEQIFGLWKMWDEKIEPDANSVDHRADQFAVGLVMLESYLGFHPFPICRDACLDQNSAKSLGRDGVGEITDKTLPEVFRKILARVFPTEPENRYRDISDLKKALMTAHEEGFGTYEKPVVEEDDSAEWWFHRGKAFMTLGRWALAEVPIREALRRCQGLPGVDLIQAHCVMSLATVYRWTNRFTEAEERYKEALRLYRCISGAESEMARCTTNLGALYNVIGRYSKAEEAMQNALKISRQIPGDVLEAANCLTNLGGVFFYTERYPEAEKIYEEALEIYRGRPGSEFEIAKCLTNLAAISSNTGRFSEAEKANKEALNIYRRIPGTEYYQAVAIENLGYYYNSAGRFSEAEKAFKEALKMHRRIPGTEIEQAKCMGSGLGHAYRESGRMDEAEHTFKQALHTLQRIPGTEYYQAGCTIDMGVLYFIQGRLEKAEKTLNEAKEILQGMVGMEDSQALCLFQLARCRLAQNDYTRARHLANEALKLCEQLPPEGADEIRADCQKILDDLEDTSRSPTQEK